MGWLDSWFSSGSSHSRKGQALSSTHDAFSLPTSSPGVQGHPDAFNPEMFGTDSAGSQYTYPPQSAGPFPYTPRINGSRSRQPSLLPLHNSTHKHPSHPPDYPPLAQTWNRLRTWLAREYPELGDTLNYGILPQDLSQIEMQFGFDLPAVVRESYLVVDGQEAESSAGCPEGLFFGLTLLPLDDVLEEWRFWRDVDEDPSTGANPRLRDVMRSLPPGWIRKEYSQRGWIPLIADKGGNYIGVDLSPGDEGAVGQVIVFGRDFDTKVVLWNGDGVSGWAKWLASFVDELEGGEGYEIGQSNDQSEGSEDGVGYESYFHDGTGRGQGDGGGDTGSGGGMRFTGEYRGWSPLEAWADRSVRKWYEAGTIPDLSVIEQPENDKAPEAIGLGVLDLANQGAEVPIPVLTQVSEGEGADIHELSETTPTFTSFRGEEFRQPMPAISVTKPPAPLPVELPTAHDIDSLSSPADSASSLDDDLEAGRTVTMREVPRDRLASQRPSKHRQREISKLREDSQSQPSPEPALVDLSSSTPLSSTPDLLTDAAPALETAAIEPSTPGPIRDVSMVDVDEAEGSQTTIRLVGGGGVSGSTDAEHIPQDEHVFGGNESEPSTEVPEITATSDNSSKAKHSKKSSIASGLKKIGNISGGGKGKKHPSSTKEAN